MQNLLTYEDLEPIFQLSKKKLQQKVHDGFFVQDHHYLKIGRELRFYPQAIKNMTMPKNARQAGKLIDIPSFTPPVPTNKRKPSGCLIKMN